MIDERENVVEFPPVKGEWPQFLLGLPVECVSVDLGKITLGPLSLYDGRDKREKRVEKFVAKVKGDDEERKA